ncbi:MAG: HAD-IA family hydrolase [Clostridia bacterium]|nr:HAD-IA family hydrolase [Clostridia bacterium]
MAELYIFDMDGVLLDSEPVVTHAALEALSTYGVEAAYGDFLPFTGMGEDRFIGGVAELHGRAFEPGMKKLTYEIYCRRAKDEVLVYPWTRPMLEHLLARGKKIAVASAADRIKVTCNLGCIGIDPSLFSAIVTGSEIVRNKPAPDIFLKAAQMAGVDPALCTVTEDALSGVMAAKAAGMRAVAVTTSFPAGRLRDAGADFVTDDLLDLFRELVP